jgi:hypothetical protein
VWSGCATIFSHHSQVTPISLPQNAAIYDTTGTQIPTFRTQYGVRVVSLASPQDDLIYIKLDSSIYEFRPRKWPRLLTVLDVYPIGIGSFVDDLSGNAFEYRDISSAQIDTARHLIRNSRGMDTVWLPKRTPLVDLNFLITTDFGGEYNIDKDPISPFYRWEFGAGLGFAKVIEIYAGYESMDRMHLTNNRTQASFTGSSITRSIKARFYPYRGFYLSTGYGWLDATSPQYSITNADVTPQTTFSDPGGVSHFHDLIIGLGYAASFSFIEFEDSYAIPHNITFGTQPLDYSFFVLKFGLNFRFP